MTNIISTDNHINEPPGLFVERIPKHLKDKAPRIMKGADGGDGWSLDGKPPTTTFGLSAIGGVAHQDYTKYKASGLRWEDILPGNYDGAEHIKDNERDGVYAATIYPCFALQAYQLADRELALACVRAYNDWLIEDFCSADPDRLWSLPLMPVNDGIAVVVGEAERVIAKGARGLNLPLSEVPYHDPMYDPLWKLAVDARIPVTIHRTGVSNKELALSLPNSKPGDGLNIVGNVQRFFSAINPISNLIYSGLFDRFAGLKFIAAEVNCNWVPGLAQQMDQQWERNREWSPLPFHSAPSSYLGKNVFVTILDDFVGARFANDDPILAATAMFSSDYPHSTTLWPNSEKFIATMSAGWSEETKEQILAGNAMRAYSMTD